MKIQKEGPAFYDALIVLGKNIGPGWTAKRIRQTRHKLSPHSIITVLAAGHLYELGIAKKLIFSGGYTAGNDMPSEAQSMARYLKKRYPKIPAKDIVLETASVNTASNARFVRQILKANSFENVAVVTVGTHAIRAEKIFKNEGISAKVLRSETVLIEKSTRDARIVKDYLSSRNVKLERAKEIVMRLWVYLDSTYRIPQLITAFTRS